MGLAPVKVYLDSCIIIYWLEEHIFRLKRLIDWYD